MDGKQRQGIRLLQADGISCARALARRDATRAGTASSGERMPIVKHLLVAVRLATLWLACSTSSVAYAQASGDQAAAGSISLGARGGV
jgi:hypothetical protein